ncbi:enoyl-CoA hydratase/isomerase family protein [Acidobacteria bacterium ACD]|nr:MAG: enoyl-CoA hydratase/isomerase family protein [Acidobacteriota bacterium]MDL1950193.1 enoyl-CoA hydratase/isomerase family protein [Acidobacteria bacterium ACD]
MPASFRPEPTPDPALRLLRFVPADRRGVLDADAFRSLAEEAGRAASDPTVTLVALLGARPGLFGAGADLEEIARMGPEEARTFAQSAREVLAAWEALAATTVAVVEGACYGGALDLVLACDLVVARPSARFGHPGVRRGIVTGWGGTARARRRLSEAALHRLFLEGEDLTASRAHANGLVDLVVHEDEPALERWLSRWAGPEGEPLRRLKSVSRAVEGLALPQALVVEERLGALREADGRRAGRR